jgi:hypothetical protein
MNAGVISIIAMGVILILFIIWVRRTTKKLGIENERK